ncbi:MAG: hypothetical protein LBO63_08560 [Oscillospiraceae bacterium]|nr:hypothetical protein [Oscillospiraceae bacterium]
MFVIGAKLCLATLLYAYAAGGSFLVLARKEPKKPLLGLGGFRCCKCRCPCVRIRTELPNDGALGPYVQTSRYRWVPTRIWRSPPAPRHALLRWAMPRVSRRAKRGGRRGAPDAPTPYGGSSLTQSVCGKPNKGRRGRRPLRRLLR